MENQDKQQTKEPSQETPPPVDQRYIDLENQINNFKKENESLKEKYKPFEGLPPEKVTEFIDSLNSKSKKSSVKDESNVDLETYGQNLRSQFGQIQTELENKIKNLEQKNHELLVSHEIVSAIADHFQEDMHGFLKSLALQEASYDEGAKSIVFKDEKGHIRYSKKNPSQRLSVEEWREEKKQKYPSATKPQGINKGAGIGNTSGSSGLVITSKEEYIRVRGTIKDPSERVRLDKQFKL